MCLAAYFFALLELTKAMHHIPSVALLTLSRQRRRRESLPSCLPCTVFQLDKHRNAQCGASRFVSFFSFSLHFFQCGLSRFSTRPGRQSNPTFLPLTRNGGRRGEEKVGEREGGKLGKEQGEEAGERKPGFRNLSPLTSSAPCHDTTAATTAQDSAKQTQHAGDRCVDDSSAAG